VVGDLEGWVLGDMFEDVFDVCSGDGVGGGEVVVWRYCGIQWVLEGHVAA